jgi:hypothetical protein
MADNIANGGQQHRTAMHLKVVPGARFELARSVKPADFKGATLPALINVLKFSVRQNGRGSACYCAPSTWLCGQLN